jgi:hypothetical protein
MQYATAALSIVLRNSLAVQILDVEDRFAQQSKQDLLMAAE